MKSYLDFMSNIDLICLTTKVWPVIVNVPLDLVGYFSEGVKFESKNYAAVYKNFQLIINKGNEDMSFIERVEKEIVTQGLPLNYKVNMFNTNEREKIVKHFEQKYSVIIVDGVLTIAEQIDVCQEFEKTVLSNLTNCPRVFMMPKDMDLGKLSVKLPNHKLMSYGGYLIVFERIDVVTVPSPRDLIERLEVIKNKDLSSIVEKLEKVINDSTTATIKFTFEHYEANYRNELVKLFNKAGWRATTECDEDGDWYILLCV